MKKNNKTNANRLSHEQWLILGLSLSVIAILGLITALTRSWEWDWLLVASVLFVVSYPLIWLAWFCYQFWRNALMQLTVYTQVLKEGASNLHFKRQHPDNLQLALQKEIAALANVNQNKKQHALLINNMLSQILNAWTVPVCIFDSELKLTYRNNAMNEQIATPMLAGKSAKELGFKLEHGVLNHPVFNKNWQCQTISFAPNSDDMQNKHWLYSAIDISQQLSQNQSVTQKNLIRVLAHEIRNSLTPMFSMTDTLLSNENLNEEQTRLVLSRINQRSSRLLSFISQYSQLSKLPLPQSKWFQISEILEEAKLALKRQNSEVIFKGNAQCFGDEEQIAQVMINLFKNAEEACDKERLTLLVKSYYSQNFQVIEVIDNGPGFANLENVLTPFYTTKADGSGIGLSLCEEIAKNHNGKLSVENNQDTGAKILMSWPALSGSPKFQTT